MEVERSFDSLFENWDCKSTGSILPLARKCISIQPSEKTVLRALEVALSFCVKNIAVDELEKEVFGFACPAAGNIVSEKLKLLETNPTGCVESFGVSLKIISFFRDVFEYLSELDKVSIVNVKTFVTVTAEVLLNCFSHCKVSNKVYGSHFTSFAENLSNFFKTCCGLQKEFLHFLTDKVECDVKDEREILLLDVVMTSLSKLGFVLITLEIKTMAEVWKTFVVLTERYLFCLKNDHNIGETINELCCSITSNIDTVISSNTDFQKMIKLSCFLLKLIIKFCELFMGCLKNCHNLLLNLLLKLYKWDFLMGSKSSQELMKQLTNGSEPLLSQLMMDEDFIKECVVVSEDSEKSAEFSILCCCILKKLLDSNNSVRSLWLNEDKNVLQWIFQSASSSQFITCSNICLPGILVNGKQKKFTDLYEYVLVITSAFLMTSTAEEYNLAEETLIKNVLQTNPIRALLAIDIWCLLARFADSELCFSQMVTLSKLFQEFHSGTFRVEKWHLASLIQRLFPLLTDSHKRAFLKSFQPPLCSSLWEGSSKFDGFTPSEVCDVCEGILSQVDHLIDEVKGPSSGKGIATLREGVMHEKFGGKIMQLWKFNCEDLSSTPQSVRFLKIACALTGCIVSEMPPVDLLTVLTQMKTLLALGQPTCTKLYFTWVLNSLSAVRIPPGELQKKIIGTTADIFKYLLSSKEALVKQKALETFYSFAHRTSHGEVISMSVQNAPELKVEITNYLKKKPMDQGDFILTDYVSELCQVKFRHFCPKAESDETVTSKKIKLDTPDMEDTVVRWRETGKKIVESFHLLSESQKTEILSLCKSILTIST